MKFKYTALGAMNQRLEGVLEAESIEVAREELHKMGMSVVGIDEVTTEEAAASAERKASPPPGDEGIITYYFLAKDPQGKEVNGTIDSKEPSSAYRRLVTEYQFNIIDLYPQNAADPVSESLKSQFDEWNKALEDEGIDLTRRSFSGTKGEMEEEGEEMSAEVITEIDQFIINTKKVISQYSQQYSDPLLAEIDNMLGELERIRSSNNLNHITKICNDLYELISNPDNVKEEGQMPGEDYEQTISNLKGSGFVSNRFKFSQLHSIQKKLARFEKLQLLIAKVSKILHRGKAKEIEQDYAAKIKKRRAHWLSQLKEKKGGAQTSFLVVISKFFSFASAPNAIMRRARKQELFKAFIAWKNAREQAKAEKKEGIKKGAEPGIAGVMTGETPAAEIALPKKDFSGFFMELDSFVGWLLFFYIAYFFLVSFSIERNIGLPRELVLKTLTSPLIVNISIFLIFAHLAFTLKIRLFRSNILGSLFLFFFCFGLYTLLIVNF